MGVLNKSGVGVATSERPEGPFVDRGAMFTSETIGVNNSIDQFYIEDGGKKYLVWGSFWGNLYHTAYRRWVARNAGRKQETNCRRTHGSVIYI